MVLAIAAAVALIAFLLIYLEFFAPGGILGTLGGVFLIISISLFFWQIDNPLWGFVYLGLMIAVLIGTIKLALARIRRSGAKNTFCSTSSQEGYQASLFDTEVIGEKGKALTNLKPAGHIVIGDQRYQAVSEGAYIRKGEAVIVLRGEGARLIVRKEIRTPHD